MDEIDQVILLIEPKTSQRIGGPSSQDDGIERQPGGAHSLQHFPVLAVAHAPERLAAFAYRARKPEGEVVPEPAAPGQVKQDEGLAVLLSCRDQGDLAVMSVAFPENILFGVSQSCG